MIVTKNRRKRVHILTVNEIEHIFDLKIEIEGAVARWAAQRGSKNQFGQLDNISKDMKRLARLRPSDEQKEDAWPPAQPQKRTREDHETRKLSRQLKGNNGWIHY